MIEKEILPYLYKGLRDKNPAVRRTGDCLSDLGFKEALPEMENALNDPQKLYVGELCSYLMKADLNNYLV